MPKVQEYTGCSGVPKYVATYDDAIANKHPNSNDGTDEHSRHAAIVAVNSGDVKLTAKSSGVEQGKRTASAAWPATTQRTNKGFGPSADVANPNYGN